MDELDVLRKKIRERMNDIADAIAAGSCKDMEDYRRMCGSLKVWHMSSATFLICANRQRKKADFPARAERDTVCCAFME